MSDSKSRKHSRTEGGGDSDRPRKQQKISEEKQDITPSIDVFIDIETSSKQETWKTFLDYSWKALFLTINVSPGSMQRLKIQIRFMDAFPIPSNQVDVVNHNPLDYRIRPLHPVSSLRRKRIADFTRDDCVLYVAHFVDFYTKPEEHGIASIFPDIIETKGNNEFIKALGRTSPTTIPAGLLVMYRTFVHDLLKTIACPPWTSSFWKRTLVNKEYKMSSWMVEQPEIDRDFKEGKYFYFIVDPALTSDGEVVSLSRQYSFFLGREFYKEKYEFKVFPEGYAKYIKGGFINKKSRSLYEYVNMTLTPSDAHQEDQNKWLFETIGYIVKDVSQSSLIVEHNSNVSFENITESERFAFTWGKLFEIFLSKFDQFHLVFNEKLTLAFLLSVARNTFFETFKSFNPNDIPDDQYDFDQDKTFREKWSLLTLRAYQIFAETYNTLTQDTKQTPLDKKQVPPDLQIRLNTVHGAEDPDVKIGILSDLKNEWPTVYWAIIINRAKPELKQKLDALPDRECVVLPVRDCSRENCGGVHWKIDYPLRFFTIGVWDFGIRVKNSEKPNERMVVSGPRHAELIPTDKRSPYPVKYRDLISSKFPEAKFLTTDDKIERSWTQLFDPFLFENKKEEKEIWRLTPTRMQKIVRAWNEYKSTIPPNLQNDIYTVRAAGKGYSRIIIFSVLEIESVVPRKEFKQEEQYFVANTLLQTWITMDDEKYWSFQHVNANVSWRYHPGQPSDNQKVLTATMFLISPDEYENTRRAITGYYELVESEIPIRDRYKHVSSFSDLFLSEITASKQELSNIVRLNDSDQFEEKMLDIVRRQSLWKWISYFKWVTLQSYQIRLESDLKSIEEAEITSAIKNPRTDLGNILKD